MFQDQASHLAAQLVLDALEEQLASVVEREAADPLQVFELIGEGLLDFGLAAAAVPPAGRSSDRARAAELVLFPVDQLELLVEDVGSFLEPPLLLAEVAANTIDLGLEILAPFEDFLLGGERRPCRRIVSASRLALARICSASPRRSSLATARSDTRRPARSTRPTATRRNRSGKLLQVAVRPDREMARSRDRISQEERARKRTDAVNGSNDQHHPSPWPAMRCQSGRKYRMVDRHREEISPFVRSTVHGVRARPTDRSSPTPVPRVSRLWQTPRCHAREPISNRAGNRPARRRRKMARATSSTSGKTDPSRLDTDTQRVVSTEISPGQNSSHE